MRIFGRILAVLGILALFGLVTGAAYSAGLAASGVTVTISTALAPDARAVILEVADTGPGIAPEVADHLFDRFAKSSESRGSGLGLAIARHLVEGHGGMIEARSRPGHGTAIRFSLPAGDDRPG